MTQNYTESAKQALIIAEDVAYKFAEGNVGTEHIIMGLMACDGTSAEILAANGVDRVKIMETAANIIDSGRKGESI